MAPELSIVIPVHGEGTLIPELIAQVSAFAQQAVQTYEVIVVDDGSHDNTWAQIQAASAKQPCVSGLQLSRNFGKEAALCAGLDHARGQAVITMDGDLQHPPALIPQLVATWKSSGVKIVEAVKADRRSQSALSLLSSRLFYWMFGLFTGVNLDRLSDFKLIDREIVSLWQQFRERSSFYRGIVWWMGFERAHVHFEVPPRPDGGASRWSIWGLAKYAMQAVTAFSSAPLQLASAVGFSFFLFAVGLGIQTLYMKLTHRAVDGFTTVILLLLIIGSLVLSCLGIIGNYIARIYDEVKARPRYIIGNRVGHTAQPPQSPLSPRH